MDTLITRDDEVYLEKLRRRIRSNLEFTVLGMPPSDSDLVYLTGELPLSLRSTKPLLTDEFMMLVELIERCENAAPHSIYEVWLDSALHHVQDAAQAMSVDDGSRLLAFFRARQGIQDDYEAHVAAAEARAEAHHALYA